MEGMHGTAHMTRCCPLPVHFVLAKTEYETVKLTPHVFQVICTFRHQACSDYTFGARPVPAENIRATHLTRVIHV